MLAKYVRVCKSGHNTGIESVLLHKEVLCRPNTVNAESIFKVLCALLPEGFL